MKITYVLNSLRIVLGLVVVSIVSCAKGGAPEPEHTPSAADVLTSTQWKIAKTQLQRPDSSWVNETLSLTDKVSLYRLTKEHLRIRLNTLTSLQDTMRWELLNNDKELQFKDAEGFPYKWYYLNEITNTETVWKDHLSGTITTSDPVTGKPAQFIGHRVILSHYPQ